MSDLTKEEKQQLKFQELAEFLGLVPPPTARISKEAKREYAYFMLSGIAKNLFKKCGGKGDVKVAMAKALVKIRKDKI